MRSPLNTPVERWLVTGGGPKNVRWSCHMHAILVNLVLYDRYA
jgi:hypothetical protein